MAKVISAPSIRRRPDPRGSVNAAGPRRAGPRPGEPCRPGSESSAAATRSSVCAAADSRRQRSRNARSTLSVSGSSGRERLPPPSCVGRQRGGQLDQGQRVTAGVRHQPVQDVDGDAAHRPARPATRPPRAASRPPTARSGRSPLSKRAQVTVAGGEQQPDPLDPQPAGHEQQGRSGSVVEPVGIVDDARAPASPRRPPPADSGPPGRSGTGRRRGARSHRTRSAAPRACGRAAGPAWRITGRSSRCRAANANGDSDSMPCVRRTRIPSARPGRVGQQRRLADAGFAEQHQRGAPPAAGAGRADRRCVLAPDPDRATPRQRMAHRLPRHRLDRDLLLAAQTVAVHQQLGRRVASTPVCLPGLSSWLSPFREG